MSAVVQAQETTPAGLVATLDVSQRLEFSDNPDLDVDENSDFFGRTTLDFGLEGASNIDSFTLNVGTDIEQGRDDQSAVDLTNSFLRFGFDRQTGNASLGVGLRFRETDVDSNFSGDDFTANGDIIDQDGGTRRNFGFDLSAAIGQEAPVGASFEFSQSATRFRGGADPDLDDQTTYIFSGQIDFRLNQRVTTRLTGLYSDLDVDGDGVDRETISFGTGIRADLTPTLLADVSLSYDDIEQSGSSSGTDTGFSLGGELTKQLRNGTAGISGSSDVTSNGRRETLSANRALELSPVASLSFAAGFSHDDDVGTNPLFSLGYRQELPRAQLALSLTQSVSANSDNQEQINTTLNGSYRQEINSLSSISASVNVLNRNELGAAADDGRRVNLSLSYQHEITRDWSVTGGISRIIVTSDNEPNRDSNTIFIGLERSFSWNP